MNQHPDPVPVSFALADYDRTRPLIDGSVGIAGCDASIISLDHEDMFVRAMTRAEFDVTEMSFSRFISLVTDGDTPYVGLPVFPSRMFRHASIYIRRDRGIGKPEDLRGRTIGVRNYANTASVAARGMLADDYQVAAADIRWLVGDVDTVERAEITIQPLHVPVDVRSAGSGVLLNDLFARGEIDGLIDYQPPACVRAGEPGVGRLFPDDVAAEQDYFRRTGVFPIMHLVVIRRDLVVRHPHLVDAMVDAFTRARDLAIEALWSPGAPRISLPWLERHYTDTVAVMGRDFWSYGIERNRKAIETMIRYVHTQGLSSRRPGLEELFAPGSR